MAAIDEMNALKSWKNVTLVPDFMRAVLEMKDFRESLSGMVEICNLTTDLEKDVFFFVLYDYILKVYSNKIEERKDFILNNEEQLIKYFEEIILFYNELTNSNYDVLHAKIWHIFIYKLTSTNIEINKDKMEEVISHDSFDYCELKHKSLILGNYIQYLLAQESPDINKLFELNEKLKSLNVLAAQIDNNL